LRKLFWHKAVIAVFAPALFLFAGSVPAASLAKIEVASHLGEPFYAEVPVTLESSESVSMVLVEIASPADYKIFEVYRDPVLKNIRADVTSDERGVRVELSSNSRIKAPFFNLILKIHSGRVSRFKKIPVFLDFEKSVQQAARQKPQPSVQPVKTDVADTSSRTALTESAGQIISSGAAKSSSNATKSTDTHYDGWARTDRYGPIVRGDSLSTVARRLMIDGRYSLSQVTLALFEKNRSSFAQDNMNLLKKNSFLDVPMAVEIEQHSQAEASLTFLEHEKKWHKLIQQPRYAAEAEAQRTRYTKHISVGEHAVGVLAAPVVVSETAAEVKRKPPVQSKAAVPPLDSASKAADSVVVGQPEKVTPEQRETSHMVARLQEQNELQQQQLVANQESIEALKQKVASVKVAAPNARIDKLEILITRLQAELEKARSQQPVSLFDGLDWIIWLLIGLLVVLLGTVAVLLRREPVHPAASSVRKPDEPVSVVTSGERKELTTAVIGAESIEETAVIDSEDKFGDAGAAESTSVDEDLDNLSTQDIDFDSFDLDVSDTGVGDKNHDQSPFDGRDFNEPEETSWLHSAVTEEEDSIRHLDSLLSKLENDGDPGVTGDEATGLEKSFFESSDDEDVSMTSDVFVLDDDLEQSESRESAHQPDELNDDEDNKKD